MSIATTDNKITYQGNGATTVWPFSFAVLEKTHLQVILTDAAGVETTLTSDYTVDLVNKRVTYPGYESGAEPPVGSQPPVLPTGSHLTLLRVVPFTQEADLGDRWPFTTIETAFDKLTMEVQQLSEESSRSVKTGVAATVTPDELLTEIRTGASTASAAAASAGASETAAAASAGTAATNAAAAVAAAGTAATDAATATAAAGTAATDAATATAAAGTATTKAAAAAASEAAVAADAATASTAASTATTKAGEAASSAAQALSASGYTVLPDHIISGGKITGTSGLTLTQGVVEAMISRTYVTKAAGETQTFEAKRLGLMTLDKAGTRGVQYAADPLTFVDNSTVGLWEPDGSATCPNLAVGVNGNTLAVANDLTKTGTVTAVGGIFGGNAGQFDGNTGLYESANSNGFPTGSSAVAFEFLFACGALKDNNTIFAYGADSSYAAWFHTDSVGNIICTPQSYNTGFRVTPGNTYKCVVYYDGTYFNLYVGGVFVGKVAGTLSVSVGNLRIGRYNSAKYFGNHTVHYVEIRTANKTVQQIAEQAAKMCLPVCWDTYTYQGDLSGAITTGTPVGNMTSGGGMAAAFDGNYAQAGTACAAYAPGSAVAYTAWIGKEFGEAAVHLTGATVYGSTDYGFSSDSVNITLTLRGSNDGGGTWDILDTQTTHGAVPNDVVTFSPTSIEKYKLIAVYMVEATSACKHGMYAAELVLTGVLPVTARANITSTLPADTISLGMVRTSATGVLAYDDATWQWGRREKASGGNRRVMLDWKSFTASATNIAWANPFGSRKVSTEWFFAEDSSGRNMAPILVKDGGYAMPTADATNVIAYRTSNSGVAFYKGAWQTSGYLGCYVEVLEDD